MVSGLHDPMECDNKEERSATLRPGTDLALLVAELALDTAGGGGRGGRIVFWR